MHTISTSCYARIPYLYHLDQFLINRKQNVLLFPYQLLLVRKRRRKKMEMRRVAAALALALSLIFVNLAGQCSGQLQFGFYNGKCKDRNGFQRNVEDIVKQKVKARFSTDTTIVAALLRMQFHDCFVNVRRFCNPFQR